MSALDRTSNPLTITLTVIPQENGQVVCQRIIQQDGQSGDVQPFYGQSQNHAIAVALEQLAEEYRKAAGEDDQSDWDAVVRSPEGDIIQQRYHVILHYERIAEDESKFEAMHNTLMGNTVVENATLAVIPVDESLPIAPIVKPWNF
jgi:hypothetical protein